MPGCALSCNGLINVVGRLSVSSHRQSCLSMMSRDVEFRNICLHAGILGAEDSCDSVLTSFWLDRDWENAGVVIQELGAVTV